MFVKSIALAALAAAAIVTTALPASAAEAEVRALSNAPIYRRASADSRQIGQLKKGATYTINYCTPPDQDWCRIVDGDFRGWVRGYELGNGAKKAFVTPFRFLGGPMAGQGIF
jgi:uncharacterized protein YraI